MQPRTITDEYGERIEESSAGVQTRRLPTPDAPLYPSPIPPAPLARRNNNNIIAITLIVVGLFAWLGRIGLDPGAMTAGLILLTISSCFLFFAFWKRFYALIIPGCVLAGLSFGIPLAELSYGVSIMWGLSMAFAAIFFLGRTMFNVQMPWPVIPAVVLFGIGMIIAFANLPAFMGAGFVWLPLLLIGAGLYLGFIRRTA
jgi:hypothetical protein